MPNSRPTSTMRIIDLDRVLDRAMQLVSDLSRHALSQGDKLLVADLCVAETHEADIPQIFAGRFLHHVQGLRPLHLKDELAAADLGDFGVVATFAELIIRPGNARPAGEQIIVVCQPHEYPFAHDLAGCVTKNDVLGLSDVELGEAVDGNRGKKFQRIAAFDVESWQAATSLRCRASPSRTCSRRSSRYIPTAQTSSRSGYRYSPCAPAARQAHGAIRLVV